MRKLSILMALMLLVSVGGVYATWSYAQTQDIADDYVESLVTLTDMELRGTNGVFDITSNLVLTIDQADDDHHAKLVFGSSNSQPIYLTITFTPADHAPESIKEGAVVSTLAFQTSSVMQYTTDSEGNYSASGTPKEIFKFVEPIAMNWGTPDPETGVFTVTYNQTQLESFIQLNEQFKLDTQGEYNAFKQALSGNIRVTISDGVVITAGS